MHRFWCWPQRSSHGQDQLGYRPCTLTRGPAPKSTTTLILYRQLPSSYSFSGNRAAKFSKKKLVLRFLGVERWTSRRFAKRAKRVVLRRNRFAALWGARPPRPLYHAPRGTREAFRRGAEKSGRSARAPSTPGHQSIITIRYFFRTPAGDA